MTENRPVLLTQEAFDRLKGELDYLESEGRTKISHEIGIARSHGDLSENAEYHAAREQQGLQEARIRQLRQMIESAEVITTIDDGVVGPGKLVTISYQGDEPETYLIGLREEKGGEHDVLTPESPIGRILIGHTAGETVAVEVPAGKLSIAIVDVRAPG
jgi:transcription elongation factor GreA